MKSVVRPELPTAAAGSSQAPTAAVDNSAPRSTHPEPTYKSGKTVQITGTTSPLHDRDSKYTRSFRAIIEAGLVRTLPLPTRSPNLNAYAERWVRSVKEECLSRLILFSAASLQRALNEFVAHYHAERNHQGRGNVLLFPASVDTRDVGAVQCRERLGGLLRYYYRQAA